MHYLSKNNDKNKELPAFFIHPYSQSKYTHLKAPIAHKTFSQEQFIIRNYNISVSFKPMVQNNVNTIKSVNGSIYASNFVRNNIPFIGTNLFFLKKISYSYNSLDSSYYSYYNFNKK